MQTHIRGGKTRHLIGVFTDKLQNVLLNLNKIKKGGELYGSFCFQKFVHFYSLNNLKSYYTQKKKFSQYLCFLIKTTILNISLSNFLHELYYRSFTCICL